MEDSKLRDGRSAGIYAAVAAWDVNPVAAKAWYGPIASWDTSDCREMTESSVL